VPLRVPIAFPTYQALTLQPERALFAGTEWKGFQRGHPKLYPEYPAAFGHQLVGRVCDVPDPSFENWLGQRVVVGNALPCGVCHLCKQHAWHLCPELQLLSGAFAPYYTLPEGFLTQPQTVQGQAYYGIIPVAETLESDLTVYAQLLAVCLHGLKRLPLQKRLRRLEEDNDTPEYVVIIGLGGIGLTLARLYAQQGAKVIGVARQAATLNKAEKLGFFESVMTPEAFTAHCRSIHQGYTTLVEATGSLEVWHQCFEWVAPSGRILFFGGVPRGTTLSVDTYALHYQELSLIGSFHYTWQDLHEALTLIEEDPQGWRNLWQPETCPTFTLNTLATLLMETPPDTTATPANAPLPWHIVF
jgi:L-iditol 2-dehydrogenase